ncbi:MAG: STAS domain-containing protein [Phycisphaerae bacterium]
MSDAGDSLLVRTTFESDRAVAYVNGEVHLSNSPRLRSDLLSLIDGGARHLIVDLSQVGYMDSSGVGTLVEIRRRLGQAGGTFALTGLQPRVRNLFEITQLDKFIRIVDTVDEARRP